MCKGGSLPSKIHVLWYISSRGQFSCPFGSRLEVVDFSQGAAEAAAEDHSDELDECHAAGHGHKVDEVLLGKVDQRFRTTLNECEKEANCR